MKTAISGTLKGYLMAIHSSNEPVPLHRIAIGDRSFALAWLVERTPGATRSNKPYFLCRFQDAQVGATLMAWSDSPWFQACQGWRIGSAYRLDLTLGEHEKYGLQMELHWLEPEASKDAAWQYMPAFLQTSSRYAVDELWAQLMTFVQTEIAENTLKQLILMLLERWETPLKQLPASDGRFYPYPGGWLEHVVSLVQTCRLLTDHYLRQYEGLEPTIQRDLVLAGAVLHDLGRVLEWKMEPDSSEFSPTVPGRLFGHVLLGRDLIRDAAAELGTVPQPILERLEHIVLSHLTLPEWGSPRLPLIPEVLILHHADDLDAKIEMYLRCFRKDQQPGPFTARDSILNKPLLKPGDWPEDRVVVERTPPNEQA